MLNDLSELHLADWELDRLTIAEVCADEVMTTLDRHSVPRDHPLFVAARQTSSWLERISEGNSSAEDRYHRLSAAVKRLTDSFSPDGPALLEQKQ